MKLKDGRRLVKKLCVSETNSNYQLNFISIGLV